MRGSLACTLTALAAVAASPAPAFAASRAPAVAASPAPAAAAAARAGRPSTRAGSPTRAQIRHAVAGLSRSSYLWATVNVCLPTPHQGGTVGIRGEMPALGFRTTLSMTIQLDQYLPAEKRYVAVKGATARRTVLIGPRSTGIQQGGAEFPFASETGNLEATVTFVWTRDGRQLAQLSRTTTGGHPSAAYGEPPGHSSATCRL